MEQSYLNLKKQYIGGQTPSLDVYLVIAHGGEWETATFNKPSNISLYRTPIGTQARVNWTINVILEQINSMDKTADRCDDAISGVKNWLETLLPQGSEYKGKLYYPLMFKEKNYEGTSPVFNQFDNPVNNQLLSPFNVTGVEQVAGVYRLVCEAGDIGSKLVWRKDENSFSDGDMGLLPLWKTVQLKLSTILENISREQAKIGGSAAVYVISCTGDADSIRAITEHYQQLGKHHPVFNRGLAPPRGDSEGLVMATHSYSTGTNSLEVAIPRPDLGANPFEEMWDESAFDSYVPGAVPLPDSADLEARLPTTDVPMDTTSRPFIDVCIDFDCTFASMNWFTDIYGGSSRISSPIGIILRVLHSSELDHPRRREFILDHGVFDKDAKSLPGLISGIRSHYDETGIQGMRNDVIGDKPRIDAMLGFFTKVQEMLARSGYDTRFTILSYAFAADIALVLSLLLPEFTMITRIVSLRPVSSNGPYSRVEWTLQDGKWISSVYNPQLVFKGRLDEQRQSVRDMNGKGRSVVRSILVSARLPTVLPETWLQHVSAIVDYGEIFHDSEVAFFGVNTTAEPCTGLTKDHMDNFLKKFEGVLMGPWKVI